MHVAIVGAGALGRVYGVRLATAGTGITFVVKPALGGGALERRPFRTVRIDGDRREQSLDAPELATSVPAHADIVVVCVRAEQVDATLEAELAGREGVPVVVVTPLLPAAFERLATALGRARTIVAMPGVVAYVTGAGITRYWLPRVAPTLLDEPRPPSAPVTALVQALIAAGLPARLELGVHETNPATTVAFIPLAMGLDAAGGLDSLLEDRKLLDLAIAAAQEGLVLSRRIGKAAGWATTLTRFVGPRMIRLGVSLARRSSPEAVTYVEEHFGRKLHAQNVAMAHAMIDLAREKGTKHDALSALAARLEERDPTAKENASG